VKHGSVSALGDFNQDGIIGAVRVVVLPQLRPQPARLAANNRVDLGVETGGPFVNLDTNQVLAELIALALQGLLHDKAQKANQFLRLAKDPAAHDFLQLFANRLRRKTQFNGC